LDIVIGNRTEYMCRDRKKKEEAGEERRLKWNYETERSFKHAQGVRPNAIDN
jgi:hypothetical protein